MCIVGLLSDSSVTVLSRVLSGSDCFPPSHSCHFHGALETEANETQLPLGPDRFRGGGGEWLCLPSPRPPCHLLWLTWRPQVLTGPWSQAWLLRLLHSSPWYSLVTRATVFHLPVFSVSMLPKTQHPPVRARVLARVPHTDLITSGAVGCDQEITAVHRPPSSLCSIQTIPQPAFRGG